MVMKKLIAKLTLKDSYKNTKFLKVFTNEEEGTVSYSYTSPSGASFALSNMQCGWRGPLLPDNTYEYKNNKQLLSTVIEAVNGGVQTVEDSKLFV
jgi:hypothetical protein